MELMGKLRNSLARFMVGRNGLDRLNQAMVVIYLALMVVRAVTLLLFRGALAARLLDIAMDVLAVLFLFRSLSRNLPRRQAENRRWLYWEGKLTSRVRRLRRDGSGFAARIADRDHKYFTCKSCKTVCRVPAGKGKIVITCPKCGAQIRGKT